jgi:membrane protein YdbS with pleckstrin-like domain
MKIASYWSYLLEIVLLIVSYIEATNIISHAQNVFIAVVGLIFSLAFIAFITVIGDKFRYNKYGIRYPPMSIAVLFDGKQKKSNNERKPKAL